MCRAVGSLPLFNNLDEVLRGALNLDEIEIDLEITITTSFHFQIM